MFVSCYVGSVGVAFCYFVGVFMELAGVSSAEQFRFCCNLMMSALTIILVSVGGVFGALLRYVLVYVQPVPVISSVILINVVGSFLIGYLIMHINSYVWAVAAIGFCGGHYFFNVCVGCRSNSDCSGAISASGIVRIFMNICSLVACWASLLVS